MPKGGIRFHTIKLGWHRCKKAANKMKIIIIVEELKEL